MLYIFKMFLFDIFNTYIAIKFKRYPSEQLMVKIVFLQKSGVSKAHVGVVFSVVCTAS